MLSEIVSMLSLLFLPGLSFRNKPGRISSGDIFLSSFRTVSCTVFLGRQIGHSPMAGYCRGTLELKYMFSLNSLLHLLLIAWII